MRSSAASTQGSRSPPLVDSIMGAGEVANIAKQTQNAYEIYANLGNLAYIAQDWLQCANLRNSENILKMLFGDTPGDPPNVLQKYAKKNSQMNRFCLRAQKKYLSLTKLLL